MIDHQPWFVADDFAQLIGAHSQRLLRAQERFEKRSVVLTCTRGVHEEVEAICDAGAYRAVHRLARPTCSDVSRWLSEVLT
ncbi:BRO-N domain-containing protein [Metapseudomonas resinovorans]|uniref:hypothetical protein n=1 Tax=Metapseudomonas resinovorans TaxID=53412 RepID=UPI0003F8CA15|nr:hypothetical protein [Pseudomonas resinovorans]